MAGFSAFSFSQDPRFPGVFYYHEKIKVHKDIIAIIIFMLVFLMLWLFFR